MGGAASTNSDTFADVLERFGVHPETPDGQPSYAQATAVEELVAATNEAQSSSSLAQLEREVKISATCMGGDRVAAMYSL